MNPMSVFTKVEPIEVYDILFSTMEIRTIADLSFKIRLVKSSVVQDQIGFYLGKILRVEFPP